MLTRGKISGIPIKIEIFEKEIKISETYGHTDLTGEYLFQYVPPYFRGVNILIKASCGECDNTDSKEIDVLGVGLDEPQMCRR